MAQILYTDAIKTELAQAVLTTVQTQIDVVSVAQMPTVTAGDWFYLTLYDNDLGDYEIVKVTDITGTVLTVERGVGNKPSLTFGIAETSVIKWIVGLDWEDLRTELQTYCATAEDLSNAIIGFLVQSQVQVLINESLEPYITIAGADLLISSFLTEAQISSLINQNLTGYTTTAEATSIAEQVFSDEVTARQLQTQSQVQTLIDAAIASVNFLSAVSITDGGETVGILSGSGTSGDPLQINWGASDPANLLDIPTNTAHTSSTDNPHNVTAAQVNCLALDNVTVFSPTADYHPATKKYVDDEVAGIANTPTIDTTDVGSDNGRIILGVDKDNAQIKYLRCWQKNKHKYFWSGSIYRDFSNK
jgi:hypothetical protein